MKSKIKRSKRVRFWHKKKKHTLLFSVFVIVSFIGVLVYILSGQRINAQLSDQTKKLRVLELRYFPNGEAGVTYHPNSLSTQLQARIRQASTFHGFAGSAAEPAISVEVVSVINRYKSRPNTDNSWETTYRLMLEEDNLCQKIRDYKIDQVWLWIDSRYDKNPGVEYAISSPMFQLGVQYATYARPEFCNGTPSFVIMGFDYSRPVWDAMHSFGHFLEGILGNLQTIELFWYRFAGNTQAGFPLTERCGNTHFPPNAALGYDYHNTTVVSSSCEDWNPDGTGVKTSFNCQRWGCYADGYYVWWMQNMPNRGNTLQYQGKLIPNWWDFLVDMDYSIPAYHANTAYFMNRTFLSGNRLPNVLPRGTTVPVPTFTPNPTPTSTAVTYCFGQCKGDVAGSKYVSGHKCIGMDNLCYVCGTNGSFTTSTSACSTVSPTPTHMLAPGAVNCTGQCKGDLPGTTYPSGMACIGMDNLCYLCGGTGSFSVSPSACNIPTPTRTPTPTKTPTPPPPTSTPSRTPTPTQAPDVVPPVGVLLNPPDGGRVTKNSNVTARVEATDNVKVVAVTIYVNGSVLCTDVTPSNKTNYTCTWRTPAVSNVGSTIHASIRDAAGNTTLTPSVFVTTR